MTEREMEDLLWEHPEKFLNEPLTQFQRQPATSVGRADVIFIDRIGRLLVIEIKRGKLERGAVTQLHDYYGMLKSQYPDKVVELMVVANHIPPERRLACEQYDIEPREISEKRFRDVAAEVGYTFSSEASRLNEEPLPKIDSQMKTPTIVPDGFRQTAKAKIEKGWYFWRAPNKNGYFLAFVNAKGSCSMRRFDAQTGVFVRPKDYRPGDYQDSFRDILNSAIPVHVSRQPNLERHCQDRLPQELLAELRGQTPQN